MSEMLKRLAHDWLNELKRDDYDGYNIVKFLMLESKNEGQMLGLKSGLEVAKDIMRTEGYDFQFPDPEQISIKLSSNRKTTSTEEKR